MDVFDGLALLGGLSLLLFGMSLMGSALEQKAAPRLRTRLSGLTQGRVAGFLTGLGVTAVIQSSSATTVMVVSLVNAGLLTLRQAIHVILGANVGTTMTAWLISLMGVESEEVLLRLLTPQVFTPVLAAIGLLLYLCGRRQGRKAAGQTLLGFSVLMNGMEAMTGAVSGLAQEPGFRTLLLTFDHPLAGLLLGAALTAVIQSSSASVGMLQALAVTGCVTVGVATPIILGQNIGTCVTALISAAAADVNGKRAALVHLLVNALGAGLALLVSEACFARNAVSVRIVDAAGVAMIHTVFNLFCTVVFLPAAGWLETLSLRMLPGSAEKRSKFFEKSS